MPEKKIAPAAGHLVRVRYAMLGKSGTFVGAVTESRPPGAGPRLDKPGKRFRVEPVGDMPGLNGWYSDRDLTVIGIDREALPYAQQVLLDALVFSALANRDLPAYPAHRVARAASGLMAAVPALVDRSGSTGALVPTEAGMQTSTYGRWNADTAS